MPLPDFLVAGVERSGTTRLANRLRAQPDFFVPHAKELHYFDRDQHDLRSYASRFRDAPHIGEATPSYLFSRDAMERIAQDLPWARLILVLRNPIDRAWSHYWFRHAWRVEPRSFEAAIADELHAGSFEYLGRGLYGSQVTRVHELFDRDQVAVFLFEDLERDEEGLVERVLAFLGAPGPPVAAPDDFRNTVHTVRSAMLWRATSRFRRPTRQSWWLPGSIDRWNARRFEYPALDPTLRARLADHFRDDCLALAELIGRDEPREWVNPS